eukprot:CAMPEP_0181492246 /NCGR_PEP_ID=MMETSP1110-20121109/50576_1 /TAXON_ID=174948 /ORGANISM="Symbiodinium sp., Strain CCMP421" /LENGTH=44 /DNA_ID= /DNA_START= /DNA_END= /DNA_ORIENTATION=
MRGAMSISTHMWHSACSLSHAVRHLKAERGWLCLSASLRMACMR